MHSLPAGRAMTRVFSVLLIAFSMTVLVKADTLAPRPLVVLVSLDGFRPDYLKRGVSPNLDRLAREGVLAKGLVPVFPSLTFPNHVSLVTGQTPVHHGIVNNSMSDPAIPRRFSLSSDESKNPAWWQAARPIWVTAPAQGRVVSTVFWPGSEVLIDGMRPHDWLPYQHGMPLAKRVATLLDWVARPGADRPDLAMIYFSDVDSAGHEQGPESKAVTEAIARVDAALGMLIEGLQRIDLLNSTTLVIVSDHGMAAVRSDGKIDGSVLLEGFTSARWEWLGATAGVRLNGENPGALLARLSKMPHLQCRPSDALPVQWRMSPHPRVPDIVCVADLGYIVVDSVTRLGPPGMHGYVPDEAQMQGLLLVSGYRITPGHVGYVDLLDVHGLLYALLGAAAPQTDGTDALARTLLH